MGMVWYGRSKWPYIIRVGCGVQIHVGCGDRVVGGVFEGRSGLVGVGVGGWGTKIVQPVGRAVFLEQQRCTKGYTRTRCMHVSFRADANIIHIF